MKELNDNFSDIIDNVKSNYTEIAKKTGVKMHNEQGVDSFQEIIKDSLATFMAFSRKKAKDAQNREFVTLQPKESLQTLTKSKITITNYLGGQYFLTVDETLIEKDNIKLIEAKHSKSSGLPSKSDIKDGLLKIILYSNFQNIEIEEKLYNAIPVLLLTSAKINSEISSKDKKDEIRIFYKKNNIKIVQQKFIELLFEEANTNQFLVILNKG